MAQIDLYLRAITELDGIRLSAEAAINRVASHGSKNQFSKMMRGLNDGA